MPIKQVFHKKAFSTSKRQAIIRNTHTHTHTHTHTYTHTHTHNLDKNGRPIYLLSVDTHFL